MKFVFGDKILKNYKATVKGNIQNTEITLISETGEQITSGQFGLKMLPLGKYAIIATPYDGYTFESLKLNGENVIPDSIIEITFGDNLYIEANSTQELPYGYYWDFNINNSIMPDFSIPYKYWKVPDDFDHVTPDSPNGVMVNDDVSLKVIYLADIYDGNLTINGDWTRVVPLIGIGFTAPYDGVASFQSYQIDSSCVVVEYDSEASVGASQIQIIPPDAIPFSFNIQKDRFYLLDFFNTINYLKYIKLEPNI